MSYTNTGEMVTLNLSQTHANKHFLLADASHVTSKQGFDWRVLGNGLRNWRLPSNKVELH